MAHPAENAQLCSVSDGVTPPLGFGNCAWKRRPLDWTPTCDLKSFFASTRSNPLPPRQSYLGIAVTIAAVIVMPLLGRAKRKVASAINSRAMQADSRQTDLCAYLSAITLVGLALNAFFGWWWADPVAAIVKVPIIVKEGIEALRGSLLCCFLPGPSPCIPDNESCKYNLDDSEEDGERPVPHRDQDNHRIDHAKDDVEPTVQVRL